MPCETSPLSSEMNRRSLRAISFWGITLSPKSLAALVDTDRINEAFHMIRGMFGISDMEWPQELIQLEKSDELQETFVSEFIFDFYDVIEDKRLETEEQEIPV